MTRSLALYMAGSCAQLIDDLRAPYAFREPGIELVSARVAMTGTIAQEVLDGAPTDVVLSANRAHMDQLQNAGLAPAPVAFARNRLALFVSAHAAGKVRKLIDLTRVDVTSLVMPPYDDPCGAYTAELFVRAGMDQAMQQQEDTGRLIVLDPANPASRERFSDPAIDVRIMYGSMAGRMAGMQVVELPPPYDMTDRIEFVAGAIVRNGVTHPGAASFIDLLASDDGRAILTQHGFLPVAVPCAGTARSESEE